MTESEHEYTILSKNDLCDLNDLCSKKDLCGFNDFCNLNNLVAFNANSYIPIIVTKQIKLENGLCLQFKTIADFVEPNTTQDQPQPIQPKRVLVEVEKLMEWGELLQFDGNPPQKAFLRQPEVHQQLRDDNAIIPKGLSIGDLIKFDLITSHHNAQYIVTVNKYPYAFDDSILHLVIWINPVFSKKSHIETELRLFVSAKLGDHSMPKNQTDKKFIIYENPNNKRSIPEVTHYHLLVNCLNETEKCEIKKQLITMAPFDVAKIIEKMKTCSQF